MNILRSSISIIIFIVAIIFNKAAYSDPLVEITISATQGLHEVINVEWYDYHASKYNIYAKSVGEDFFKLKGTVPAPLNNFRFTPGCSDEHYIFYIVPEDVLGVTGPQSNYVEGWASVGDDVDDLIASQGTLDGKVSLTWTSLTDANSYKIYRSTTPGGTKTLLATLSSGANSYDDTSIKDDNHYIYSMEVDYSNISSFVCAKSNSAEGWVRPISVISDLAATQGTVDNAVNLSWTGVPEATSYEIWRSTTSGSLGSLLATKTTASHSDSTAQRGTTYYYTVKVKRENQSGASSNIATGWLKPLPEKVGDFTIDSVYYDKVRIDWEPANYAETYTLYRSTSKNIKGSLLVQGLTNTEYNDTSVVPGTTYWYTVVGVNSAGPGPDSAQSSGSSKVFNTPTNLTATQGTLDGKVSLTWTAVTDADSYEIYRSTTPGGTKTLLATLSAPNNSYDDASITTSNRYYYTVKAKVYSVVSSFSSEAIGWRKLPVVSNLTATQGTVDNAVNLSWTAAPEATGYEIWRSTTSGSLGSLLATKTTTSHTDTGTGYSAHYFYTVKVKVGTLIGDTGNQAEGWGKKPLPSQVIGVNATQGTVYGESKISWIASINTTSYSIFRSDTSGSKGSLLVSNLTTTTYSDKSVSGPTHYFYTVVASNDTDTAADSLQAEGWAKVPGVISDLSASQGAFIEKVLLTWTANPDATEYEIWRSDTVDGEPSLLATVTSTTFNDSPVMGRIHYFYTVKAKVNALIGGASNQSEGWGKVNFPVKITGIDATKGIHYGKSVITWAADPYADSYTIYRSTTFGTKGPLLGSNILETSFDDTTVSDTTHYFYTVVGVNTTGNGPDSDQVEGWGKIPNIVTTMTATKGTLPGKVRLTWTEDSDATGYEIYRSASPGAASTLIASLTSPVSSYEDESIINSLPYYYTIKVKIGNLLGPSSAETSGWRKLPVVSNLSASKGTHLSKVVLNWSGDAEASGYEIWRSDASNPPVLLASLTGTTYTDSTVGADTHFFYTVKAKVGALVGDSSNQDEGWGRLPKSITSLAASQGKLTGKVTLTWDNDPEAEKYEVWRSETAGGVPLKIATLTKAGYEDATTGADIHYFYTIRSIASALTGNPSNEAEGWGKLPNAITSLLASKGELISKVNLIWNPDKEATGYEIYRSDISGSPGSLLATVGTLPSSYTDDTVLPSTNYYYTVRTKVNALLGNPSNEALGFAKPVPPAPVLEFKGGIKFAPDSYYVPLGQFVTKVIPRSATAPLEPIKITYTDNGQNIERLKVRSGSAYPINATDLALNEERDVNLRVGWQNFPDVYVDRVIKIVGGAKQNLKLTVESPAKVTDSESVAVKVKLGEYVKNILTYDPVTMGQWRMQLLAQTDTQSTKTPITDWIDLVDGQADVTIDPMGNQYLKITAVSEFKSNAQGLSFTINSPTRFIEVVKGTPIEGSISAKQFDGLAPKTFTLNLDLTKGNRIALKAAYWEESYDGGATWSAMPNTGTRINVPMPDPDRKMIRAKMINKNSSVESYTDPVELFAYPKIYTAIIGPKHAAPNTSVTLSAQVLRNGIPINDAIVEWTITYGNGGKQTSTGNSVIVSNSVEDKIIIAVRARSSDTRPEDIYAWSYARHYVQIKNPTQPTVLASGAREVETGKTYHYTGKAKPSWGALESVNTLSSEWQLPDGSTVAGDELDWTPTADVIADPKPLIYRVWVDGFKSTTVNERSVSYKPWEYVWPNWSMTMKQMTVQAPSDLNLLVTHDLPTMNRRFESLSYEWSFPPNVNGRQNGAFPNRASAQALYAGEYDISVTIRDSRGHETVLTQHVVTEAAEPYSATLKVGKSNLFGRAPMKVTVRPTVSGGHPLDKITGRIWKVDGVPVNDYANRSFMVKEIAEAGDHLISYTLSSKMGETLTVNEALFLVPNLPPICQLTPRPSAYVVYAEAKCTDPDGKIIGYNWQVNGQPISAAGYRISFSKTGSPQSAHVTITATDDAYALSTPVSIDVNY